MNRVEKKIIIVGAGFGGIRTALDLEKKIGAKTNITLINDKPHFEYTPALYRIVTGRSPLEVCVPIKEIFEKKKVLFIRDAIVSLNLKENSVTGTSGSKYVYDYLVLALGSETEYFEILGLKERSFGFKTIAEALRLKRHLHETFEECEDITKAQKNIDQKTKNLCSTHIVIIGAGPSGVELASELALYCKKLAKKHFVDSSLVTIDLIEAAPRILPLLPENFTKKIEARLRSFGINIYTNREVVREEIEDVYMKDMQLKTKTVIWAAGIRAHSLGERTQNIELSKRKKIMVDEHLRLKNHDNVFVIGDVAETEYSGMAQTALHEARETAKNIIRHMKGKALFPHRTKRPGYIVPVGPGWAGIVLNSVTLYGKLGWFLRQIADLRFFISILPPKKAWSAFHEHKTLCESCEICLPETLRTYESNTNMHMK